MKANVLPLIIILPLSGFRFFSPPLLLLTCRY